MMESVTGYYNFDLLSGRWCLCSYSRVRREVDACCKLLILLWGGNL